jgi:hypothetical protein
MVIVVFLDGLMVVFRLCYGIDVRKRLTIDERDCGSAYNVAGSDLLRTPL